MMAHSFAVLVFAFLIAVVTANKGFVLREFRQEDSVTSCQSGLINLLDKIVFTAQVNVTELGENLRSMAYEIKRPDSFTFKSICFKKIPTSCKGVEDRECYCVNTFDKHIYIFILNITAYSIYSRGQIRLVATCKNLTSYYSDTKEVPKIYDPTFVKSRLHINNQIMNETNCHIEVKGSLASIEYTCVGDKPSPCWLEIVNLPSNLTMVNGFDHIFYTFHYQESTNLSLILKKQFCQSGEVQHFFCTIYAGCINKQLLISCFQSLFLFWQSTLKMRQQGV